MSAPDIAAIQLRGASEKMPKAKSQYQERDFPVVDYELYELQDFPYMLRGPQPVAGKDYISVIGAGQSFGVLVRKPYAHMIRSELGAEVLNLSVGGAAPALYLPNKTALSKCNSSKVCIVQALSARSTVCSYFETQDGKNMLRPRGSKLPFIPGDTAFDAMFRMEPQAVAEMVVREIQSNWVKEVSAILRAIHVPKIFLWFSKRKPEALGQNFTSYQTASGVFPHFVNRRMIEKIRPLADEYVEVVSSRGVPNKLTDRMTGKPTKILLGDQRKEAGEDHYYPSPEMHEDAFALLRGPLEKLLRN